MLHDVVQRKKFYTLVLQKCLTRSLIRYEELYAIDPNQARATPKEHHDGIVENLVDNLKELESEKLFDQIQIYQRDRTCIFDSETDEGSAAEVLQDCLFGKWSKVEEEMMKVGKERLRELHKGSNKGMER